LGSIYSLKNQLEDSRKAYQQALELNPGFTESYYGLGTTLEKQKKLDEALKVYQQYLEKAPSSAAYVPLAKQRVDILKKTMPTPTTTPAQVKPVSTGASPNARR
jgi:superkiller protein 3